MTSATTPLSRTAEEAAYHQARVLLLIDAATREPRSKGRLQGLTKLAKMDFLVRYPALIPAVLGAQVTEDWRLRPAKGEEATVVDDPMIRYKYGPWDTRYYEVIGGLVGRGLVILTRGRRSELTFATTDSGHAVAEQLASADAWQQPAHRCAAIADLCSGMTGSRLKGLIYERLADLMDRPYREVIT